MKIVDVVKMNPKLVNASNYLSTFRLDVRHILGKLNLILDALLRLPTEDDQPLRYDESVLEEVVNEFGDSYVTEMSLETTIDLEFKKEIE